MFFKNLQLFRLDPAWVVTQTHFQDNLARGLFFPCPSNDPMSRGWVPPRGPNGSLVESISGHWLFALQVQQRLLPSSVVAEEAAKRAGDMEKEQGYRPGRKQMRELRERIAEELMPRAFTRSRRTFVWLDPESGGLGIDASTPAKAEEVIEHLRKCLDDFPLQVIRTRLSPTSAMADWLASGEGPAGFTIDRDSELKAVGEEKAAVRYVRHPLEGSEIKEHLAAGKLPTRLALTWDDRLSFVLTERTEVKRLAFLDIVKEEAEQNAEHADEQFDADFALMAGELSRFVPALLSALGGEIQD